MIADTAELTISRYIDARPALVWKAWSQAEHLARWWIPAPIECRVVKLDLKPGGGFETLMREDGGEFMPHVEACFLEVEPERSLVFTTVLTEGWRPHEPWLALTADIGFQAEGDGTRYMARVMHRTPDDSRKHEQMGFHEGWGATLDQLAALAKSLG